jgi:hypothetical protein
MKLNSPFSIKNIVLVALGLFYVAIIGSNLLGNVFEGYEDNDKKEGYEEDEKKEGVEDGTEDKKKEGVEDGTEDKKKNK